jgi:hypothetical protein
MTDGSVDKSDADFLATTWSVRRRRLQIDRWPLWTCLNACGQTVTVHFNRKGTSSNAASTKITKYLSVSFD